MAASEAIIGEEWKARSQELADWAMAHLVNRRDVWGQYSLLPPMRPWSRDAHTRP
ncbi:MAG: hypothetical protein ACO3ZD_02815 [Cyanobium sp.]